MYEKNLGPPRGPFFFEYKVSHNASHMGQCGTLKGIFLKDKGPRDP